MKRFNYLVTGTAGGVFIFTLLTDLVKSEPFLSTVKNIGIWLWTKLSYTVPIWLALAVAIALLLSYLAYNRFKQRKLPPFFNYREDTFIKWKWSWAYEHNGNRWDIVDITAHCQYDDTQLSVTTSYPYIAHCPFCKRKYIHPDGFEDIQDIERLILRELKIRYPNSNS